MASAALERQNAAMQLHTDYLKRVVIRPDDVAWSASPEPGVERRRLERDGDEVARATSIVRYAPGSRFAAHTHGGGEEILVLDGVFEDEFGAYPAGSYLRNPVGSRHTPFSTPGATLLVKLWQFDPADRAQLRIPTRALAMVPGPAPGLAVLPLHSYDGEHVRLEQWSPGTRQQLPTQAGGEEFYVLEGSLSDELGDYPAGTWVRDPPGSRHLRHSTRGALVYVKTGHLPPRTPRPPS